MIVKSVRINTKDSSEYIFYFVQVLTIDHDIIIYDYNADSVRSYKNSYH